MTTVEIAPLEPYIAIVRLARSNAIRFDLVADINTAFDTLGADGGCRVVVLTGIGSGFCASLDLGDLGRAAGAWRARAWTHQVTARRSYRTSSP